MSPAGDQGTAGQGPSGQGPSGMELLGLGFLIAAAVVVPLVLGLVLDATLHSAPVFFFIGLFLGVIGAVATVYTRFKRYL